MLSGMGKMYCAECGSLMVGSAYKSHGTKYTYYVCPNHKGNACKTKNLRASYLEHLLCGIITTNILTKKNYNEYNDLINTEHGRKSHIGLNKELSGVIKAINNILKVIETNPTEEAAERLSVLSKRKEEIQKRIESLNDIPKITEENYNDIRKAFYKELKTSSDPMIYDMIDRLVNEIIVSNDGVKIELNI